MHLILIIGIAAGRPLSEETVARLKSDAISMGLSAGGAALSKGEGIGISRLGAAGVGAGIGLITAEVQNAWTKHSTMKMIEDQKVKASDSRTCTENNRFSEKQKFQVGNDAISAVNGAALGAVAAGPYGAALGGVVGVAASEGVSHLVNYLDKTE